MSTQIIKTEPTTFLTREALAWYVEYRRHLPVMYVAEMKIWYVKSLTMLTREQLLEEMNINFNLN